ncbi:MAG: hypothetical protein H6918_02575 [Sphingomonadaceae bacterium]|nr:hypothetical protein [Sphingomonadaceae bacterium]
MQDESTAKASLKIGANSLQIEGGEEFVERLVEKLGIVELMGQIDFSAAKAVASANSVANAPSAGDANLLPAPENSNSVLEEFDEVYAETDTGFTIIADAEENTIAKTARNYILLHLYGSYLLEKTEVSDDELRQVCITHACYDPGNFAHHVKGLGSKVIRLGGSRTYSLKLTAPGIRAAKQYALDVQKRAMSQ